MNSVPAIVQALANIAQPWRDAYSDSKVLSIAVMFMHLAALLIGGGLAVAADRSTLLSIRGDVSDRNRILRDLHGTHRPVVIALIVLWISGLLLAAADVETFAVSPAFWVKITVVTLLMVNGLFLYRTESSLRHQLVLGGGTKAPSALETTVAQSVRQLRFATIASIVLWIATVLAGVVLEVAA